MNSSASEQFSWVGQFLEFVPGNKSPYQYLALKVVAADDQESNGQAIEIKGPHQVSLSKSLRRMLMGYLAPQNWIRVIGKAKVNAQTGEMQWRAREIVRLSPQQVNQYANTAVIDQHSETSRAETPRTIRVLICQKSSCRQRGSQAIEAAIARTIKSHDSSTQFQIQPTGCMKQCKAGPHLVLIPPKPITTKSAPSQSPPQNAEQVRSTQRYARVTPAAASQIVEQLL